MTQFVYFYVQAPDQGDELKLSMASVRRNFSGKPTFLVIGEKPPWYDGPHIPLRKFTGIRDFGPRMAFRDTQHKIMQAAASDLVKEEFVWIMDDCFMLKKTTMDDLRIPRYDPWYKINVKTIWHQLIRITFAALKRNGKSQLQYGTHLPHVFRKSNLKAMFELYDFPNQLLLFEILYQNHFSDPKTAVPYGGNYGDTDYPQFLRRLIRPATTQELDGIDANFLNYQAKCFNPPMKRWLHGRFDT